MEDAELGRNMQFQCQLLQLWARKSFQRALAQVSSSDFECADTKPPTTVIDEVGCETGIA